MCKVQAKNETKQMTETEEKKIYERMATQQIVTFSGKKEEESHSDLLGICIIEINNRCIPAVNGRESKREREI